MSSQRLTLFVFLALCLGGLSGLLGHAFIHQSRTLDAIGDWLDLITTLFLRAIYMLIAPLVLSTLLSGMAHTSTTGTLGRVAARALGWFILASIAALFIGLAVVEIQAPGVGLHLTKSVSDGGNNIVHAASPSLAGFLSHLLPSSIVEAMSRNEVLQIVIFAILAGVALTNIGEKGAELARLADAVAQMTLRMASYVMLTSPVAVFSALASVLLRRGSGIIATFGAYVGGIYFALAILWIVLIAAGGAVLGMRRQWELLKTIREPVLLAFATTSSESAYPVLLAKLNEFGVPNCIASFILPLGYSFNLVGSMCYGAYAALFLAQSYDVHLAPGQVAQLLLLLFLASKGIANVPRASLLVVAAILPYFGVPGAGVVLVLAVDSFVDMGRTCTNTMATAIAAASVAKWEHSLPLNMPIIRRRQE